MGLEQRIDPVTVREQLSRVLQSRVFAKAQRSQRFLSYLVEAALADPPSAVKEYTVAIDVFDRDSTYDPSVDATVRVEASRLRSRLRDYYLEEGKKDLILIDVPRGSYAAVLTHRNEPEKLNSSLGTNPAGLETAAPKFPLLPLSEPASSRSLWIPGHRPWYAIAFALCVVVLAFGARYRFESREAGRTTPGHPQNSFSAKDVSTAEPATTRSAEAREQYQRGLYYYDRRNALASTDAFRRAIELDPKYTPAYAGLAMGLESQALMITGLPGKFVPEAIAAANKAIALDPTNGEAYLALGDIQGAFTWQWPEAEQNLKRGLVLSPQDAPGHMSYALLLEKLDREKEATSEAEKAVSLSPLSFYMLRMQGSILYYQRHYDDSVRVLERAREMQSQNINTVDLWVGWDDEQRGLYDEAVAHDLVAREQEITPAQSKTLLAVYHRRGWQAYWAERLRLLPPQPEPNCYGYQKSLMYLRTGNREAALAELKQATAQHCFWMSSIHVDPALDPLRGDRQFQEIERAVDGTAPLVAIQEAPQVR